ncbi:MAG: cytochrome c biogenesis protein ResB [Smithellaceae bacterium]
MSKNKSGVWSFFTSLKLTLVLLAVIVLLAVVGTLVPQREAALELSRTMSPGLYAFLYKMQIFDMYHSIWFFLLMGLLAVNLIICSVDRFPQAWQRFKKRPALTDRAVFENLPEERHLRTHRDTQQAAGVAEAMLKKRLGRVQRADAEDGVYLCADKGRFSHFGVYIVHLSILVLIAGVLVGSLFGVEGYVQIAEGETVSVLNLRDNKGAVSLPFAVRCDKFTVEFYENGMPKTYQSDLTFFKDNQIARQGKLRVNHPLVFEDFRFYQSSFGRAQDGMATLALMRRGGKEDLMNVSKGYLFELPGGEGTFRVLRVEEDLMKMGPAVKLAVRSKQGPDEVEFWVFQHVDQIREISPDIFEQVPVFNPGLFRPYTFALLGLEEKYFTGLQVSRDPGVPLVAAFAVILIAGLLLLLMTYARQLWIRVSVSDGATRITVAGRSFRNAAGLNREIDQLLADMAERLENAE